MDNEVSDKLPTGPNFSKKDTHVVGVVKCEFIVAVQHIKTYGTLLYRSTRWQYFSNGLSKGSWVKGIETSTSTSTPASTLSDACYDSAYTVARKVGDEERGELKSSLR